MEREKQTAIFWQRPFAWRAGERYVAPGASAASVVRFEREEYGNALDVPDFLLEELDTKGYLAADIVWVCRTRDHARRYGRGGNGQPYKEDVGPHALIIASDQEEPERGYLVLDDASRLDPAVVERYARYRRTQRTGEPDNPRRPLSAK